MPIDASFRGMMKRHNGNKIKLGPFLRGKTSERVTLKSVEKESSSINSTHYRQLKA